MMKDIVEDKLKPKLHHHAYISLKNILQELKEMLNIYISENKNKSDNVNILDIGCGQKPYEKIVKEFLTKKGLKVNYIGVDVNEKSSADYILDLNKDKLPFKDNSFDIIIMTEVLEHIYNTDNVLSEAVRCLKNGGYIFISTPFVYPYHEEPNDYYRFTKFFYEKKLIEKGLTIKKIKYHNYFFSLPFLVFNVVIAYSPYIPSLVKKMLISLNNCFVILLEYLQNFIIENEFLEIKKKEKINYFPLGLIIIAKFQ